MDAIDWLSALCDGTSDPMETEPEESFPVFFVNRGFSIHPDTIFHAAEVNLYRDLPHRLVYDYYKYGVKKKRRYGKWPKRRTTEDQDLVSRHYGISSREAGEYLRVLTKGQIEVIRSLSPKEK
jgi:hypothetical protein